jgi:predicted dehydrogenase
MSPISKNDKVSVGVAGAGYWGPNLIRNVAANPEAELAAICDSDPAALQREANKYPGVAQFTALDEMLAQPTIDAVVISTPSGLHFEHVLMALHAGKHVFVEKPMASSVKEAVELVKTAEDAGGVLMVGHTFLYNNIVLEIKRRIDKGELGKIYYAYSERLNLGQFRRDSDVLWTLAPQDVSILNYWFQARPHQVSAHGRSHVWPEEGIVDVCFCLLEYPDGCAVHLHLSWMDPQKVRKMVVVGSKKMLVYDDVDPTKHIQIFDKGIERRSAEYVRDYADFKTRLRAGDLLVPNVRLVEPLSVEIAHFVDCVRDGNPPMTDGRHGLEVTCILEALASSMKKGGDTVQVEYPKSLRS